MRKINFTDKNGTFTITNPENYSGLYLPLAGEEGLKSSITPTLGGDSKTDQNHFLLEPVSIENLHNNRGTRNFWQLPSFTPFMVREIRFFSRSTARIFTSTTSPTLTASIG